MELTDYVYLYLRPVRLEGTTVLIVIGSREHMYKFVGTTYQDVFKKMCIGAKLYQYMIG